MRSVTYTKDDFGVAITSFRQIGEIISRLSEYDFEKKWKKQQGQSVSENEIVAQMNAYLFGITKLLLNWLDYTLPKIRKDWWDVYIMQAKIPFPESYEKAYNTRDLSLFDLSALLNIAKSVWNRIKNLHHIHHNKWHKDKIDSIYALHRVRNDWGHILPGHFPKNNKIIDDLRALEKFILIFNENNLVDYKNLAAEIKCFRMSLDA